MEPLTINISPCLPEWQVLVGHTCGICLSYGEVQQRLWRANVDPHLHYLEMFIEGL